MIESLGDHFSSDTPVDLTLAKNYQTSLRKLLNSDSIQRRHIDALINTETFSRKLWKHHLSYYLRINDIFPNNNGLVTSKTQRHIIKKALTMLKQQYHLEVHETSELFNLMEKKK